MTSLGIEKSRFELVGIIFLFLALAPTLFSLSFSDNFEFPKFSLLLVASSALLLKPLRPKLTPVTLGVFLFLVSAALSTLFSISPRQSLMGAEESFFGLLTVGCYLVLFLSAQAAITSAERLKQTLSATVIAASVMSAYGLLQALTLDPIIWRRTVIEGERLRIFSTMGNSIFFATYLAMAFPVTFYFMCESLQRRRWFAYAFLNLVALALIVCVVLSGSRGSWFAALGSMTVMAVGTSKLKHKRTALTAAGIFSGLLTIAVVVAFRSTNLSSSVWATLKRLHSLTAIDMRIFYWRGGLSIFKRYPVFGSGLDAFQIAFQHVRTSEYWKLEFAGSPYRAHNELINILATQGIIGGVVALALGLAILWQLRETWLRLQENKKFLFIIVTSSITAFLIQELTSFTVIGCGSLFVVLVGSLESNHWSQDWRSDCGDKSPNLHLAVITGIGLIFVHNFIPLDTRASLAIAVLTLVAGLSCVALAGIPKNKALVGLWLALSLITTKLIFINGLANIAATKGSKLIEINPVQAITEIEHAITLDRNNESYVCLLGMAAQHAARITEEPQARIALLRLSARAFEHAIKLVPARANNHYNLAITLSQLAAEGQLTPTEVSRSREELATALKLEPNNTIYLRLLH